MHLDIKRWNTIVEDQMQLMLFTCFKLAKPSDILGKQSIS